MASITITPLSTTTIRLNWTQPFSLNLTTTEPDIIFCVDTYSTSAESEINTLLLSDCNVSQHEYNFTLNVTDPNHRDLFLFKIIPRSNVLGSRNGTSNEPVFGYFPSKNIIYDCGACT